MKMIIVTPKPGYDISMFEEAFDFRTLNYLMYAHQNCTVNLKMPKFEIKSTVFLKRIMKKVCLNALKFNFPRLILQVFFNDPKTVINVDGLRKSNG